MVVVVAGFLVGAAALVCNNFYGGTSNTLLGHSFWHILGGLALICFILARELRPPIKPVVIDLSKPPSFVKKDNGSTGYADPEIDQPLYYYY